MKGFNLLGAACVLFLFASQTPAEAAQETLQNTTACSPGSTEAIGCTNGNPNDMVECFNNATLTSPYQLTEASFEIVQVVGDIAPLSLVIYEWSGVGQPGAVIETIALSAIDSMPGQHTIMLDPAVQLTTTEFCVGVSSDNPLGWFNLTTGLPNIVPTSWFKADQCGVGSFTDIDIFGLGNWCITATIEEEVVDTSIEVAIDIKFCSDPNAFSCKKNGVLPVTLFGTESFDVADVDVSTLRLCLEDQTTCTGAPRDASISDRGNPVEDIGAGMCAVNPDTGMEENFRTQDGFMDLDVTFEANEVQDTLLVDTCGQPKGTVSPTLFIVGTTFAGDTIYSLPLDDVAVDQLVKKDR